MLYLVSVLNGTGTEIKLMSLSSKRGVFVVFDGVSFARLMTTRTAVERMVSITVVQKGYHWS